MFGFRPSRLQRAEMRQGRISSDRHNRGWLRVLQSLASSHGSDPSRWLKVEKVCRHAPWRHVWGPWAPLGGRRNGEHEVQKANGAASTITPLAMPTVTTGSMFDWGITSRGGEDARVGAGGARGGVAGWACHTMLAVSNRGFSNSKLQWGQLV